MGSWDDNGSVRSGACVGRDMDSIKSLNPVVCGSGCCCKLLGAVDDVNKLANTLLLVLPVLVELQLPLQLPVNPVTNGSGFSTVGLES